MAKPKQKFDLHLEDVTNNKVKQLANRKRFHPQDLVSLTPLNDKQQKFFDSYNADTPFILQSGAAGTGKTMLALYAALNDVFDPAKPQEKVVIFRSAVESRKVGFLPGTLEEKAMIYELPYRTLAAECIKDFKDPYNHLKALGYIDFQLTSYQRGTTYDDCIMLIDETQNLDRGELLTILSRVGQNSRIILCGDSKQSDLERYREKSSFSYLQKLINMLPYGTGVEIHYDNEDIVRSGLARDILIADSYIED